MWVTLYQWSCHLTGVYYNWSFIGAGAYLILFQASTWLTELLSKRKYPDYAEYQQRVGRFLPKLSIETPGEWKANKAKKTTDSGVKKA